MLIILLMGTDVTVMAAAVNHLVLTTTMEVRIATMNRAQMLMTLEVAPPRQPGDGHPRQPRRLENLRRRKQKIVIHKQNK